MNLAIIGAGMAGLAAARALRQLLPSSTITIFEKSRGPGGRVATRRRDRFVFDHGAQLFRTPGAVFERLIQHELPTQALRQIPQPVWVFDAAGVVAPGDPAQNSAPQWVYADGINRLGKLLAEGSDVRREVRVVALHSATTEDAGRRAEQGRQKTGDRRQENSDMHAGSLVSGLLSLVSWPSVVNRHWSLLDTSGQAHGPFDAVLLTAPAPQTAEILAASQIEPALLQPLLHELGQASYRRCLSLALAYNHPISRPFYALVNTDRQHPISWLALEHSKGPERCPPGHSLLIAQLAPAISQEWWELPAEAVATHLTALIDTLLGETLPAPLWADRQGWRYALPDSHADAARLHALGAPLGLYFAGDYTTTQGRVHLAIESGWAVAGRLARYANQSSG